MKRVLTLAICVLFALGHFAAAHADGLCRVRSVQKSVVQTKFVTPYAVALGVPVANYSGVSYSYNGSATQSAASDEQIKRAVKAALLEILQNSGGDITALTQSTPTLVQQNCAACHTGDLAKGGFRVDQPLDDASRLLASRQVLLGEMPRGKQIDEQTRGNLLGELVGVDSK
ncbi:MAG: hypothetical protein MPJ50_02525 [Pirellulales bacterium]|nr:hypothetical protein [Pirellulales bacterium]